MKALFVTVLASMSLAVSDPVAAQSDTLAAERAKLGNQRAQSEAELRARAEEEHRKEAEAIARVRAEEQAQGQRTRIAAGLAAHATNERTPVDSAVSEVSNEGTESADLTRALEQLRMLGDLKDAGHLTEEEFQRIKARILNGL